MDECYMDDLGLMVKTIDMVTKYIQWMNVIWKILD
jgi:hypothetical protein